MMWLDIIEGGLTRKIVIQALSSLIAFHEDENEEPRKLGQII
jgi:hypothetical protein